MSTTLVGTTRYSLWARIFFIASSFLAAAKPAEAPHTFVLFSSRSFVSYGNATRTARLAITADYPELATFRRRSAQRVEILKAYLRKFTQRKMK